MTSKPRVGIIGCGKISKAYLTHIQTQGVLDVVAVADLLMERAAERAAEFHIPRALAPEQLLADPEVEYVLNLTVPQAHLPVAMNALQHGKHVYNEKPLAVTREEAQVLRTTAKAKNLRLGCAPDTFLGAGLQTCRKWLDAGKIGQPISLEIAFNLRGYKDLNAFHWKRGGGVLMDLGPYYFTAMAALLGPVKRISAFTRYEARPELKAGFPNWKQLMEVPSHIAAIAHFHSGVLGNITLSTETCGHYYDVLMKIYGDEATMICPDPNMFDGEAAIVAFGKELERVKTDCTRGATGRGAGLADMALAQRAGRPHRANDELAYHVLDMMCAVTESAEQGRAIDLPSTCHRPEPFDDSR